MWLELVDQPSRNGVTAAAAAQWWSAEQCPDDAQGQGGPTDRPDRHQTKLNPRSIYANANPMTDQIDTKPNPRPIYVIMCWTSPLKIELQKMSFHLSRCASVWFEI